MFTVTSVVLHLLSHRCGCDHYCLLEYDITSWKTVIFRELRVQLLAACISFCCMPTCDGVHSFIHLQSIDPIYSYNRQQDVDLVKKVNSVAI
jgi:hypothetical protein